MQSVHFVIDDVSWTWSWPHGRRKLARAVRRGALPLHLAPSWTGNPPVFEGELTPGEPGPTDDEVRVATGDAWSATAFLGDDLVSWRAMPEELGQTALKQPPPDDPAVRTFVHGLSVPAHHQELVFAMSDDGERLLAWGFDGEAFEDIGAQRLSTPLVQSAASSWDDQVWPLLQASMTQVADRLLNDRAELPVSLVHECIGERLVDGTLTRSGLSSS